MRRTSLLLLIAVVSGCAAPGHLTTPSGKPEITVHASIEQAQKVSLAWLLGHGYEVGEKFVLKDVMLRGGKDVTSGFASAMGGTDIEYVLFNFIDRDSNTTTIYANKETANSRLTPAQTHRITMTQNNSQEEYENLQHVLTLISDSLNAQQKRR
jgi:hypothetical protein